VRQAEYPAERLRGDFLRCDLLPPGGALPPGGEDPSRRSGCGDRDAAIRKHPDLREMEPGIAVLGDRGPVSGRRCGLFWGKPHLYLRAREESYLDVQRRRYL
nr:hypothetical protein [Bacillota bacterium]